jgi:hypothetical protein
MPVPEALPPLPPANKVVPELPEVVPPAAPEKLDPDPDEPPAAPHEAVVALVPLNHDAVPSTLMVPPVPIWI